jgi:plastocyanin
VAKGPAAARRALHFRRAAVPRREDVTAIAIWTKHHPAATSRAAVLLAMMASGVPMLGCGDDEQPATKETAATKTPAQKSAADSTGNTLDASSEPSDARIEIVLKDIAFKPQYITARVGQTLVFTNEDEVAHKVKGHEGLYYASKTLSKSQSYEYTIKKDPGQNLSFTCTIHPEMKGGVVLASK